MLTDRKKGAAMIWGSLLIGFGCLFLWWNIQFATGLFAAIALLFLLQVLWKGLGLLRKKGRDRREVLAFWFHLFLTIFFFNNALLPAGFLAIILVLEFFVLGCILFIDLILQWNSQKKILLWTLFDALLHLFFSIYALVHLEGTLGWIYSFLGLSLIVRGFTALKDAWDFDRPSFPTRGRRKHLGLPIFLSAIIPVSALNAVNRLLNPNRSQPILLEEKGLPTQQPDLEIWIHTARKGFEMMGHVDISYKGMTYAYGQYDVDSARFFGIMGDGVLFRLSSEDYLASLAQEDWRAVLGYGMVLTDAQKQAIEERLGEMMSWTQPFYLTSQAQKESYLGQLNQRYRVDNFKFTQTKFKTYFVMTTNCVLLADTILAAIGTDNVANHGILTPGVYQDYFEREYQKPHSAIVSKFVLGKQISDHPSSQASE